MPESSIRIRMYRQGLGDCFLLTFPRPNGGVTTDYHILIDCGVITGTDSAVIIKSVEDIASTTNHHLDLVVGTHEHWDHLSGFNQAREQFDQIKIDNVWLAWTEDADNGTAKDLRKKRADKVAALHAVVSRMAGLISSDQALGVDADQIKQRQRNLQSIRNVLSFFGEEPVTAAGPALGLKADQAASQPGIPTVTTRDAMHYLASRKDAAVQYCSPSMDPLTLKGVDGLRIYVFGPPEDPKKLKRTDASGSQKGKETYGLAGSDAGDTFLAAITGEDDSQFGQLRDLSFPFDNFYRIKPEVAMSLPEDDFFRRNYGFANDKDKDWRRIDNDWMNVTSELALNLDSDTNNTSLVLAFEVGEPGSGKVLLFAADAQVGSWETWPGLTWTIKTPGMPSITVTGEDLMRRTVLYKVGHHGSHNATLKEGGLELMGSDQLVALIPVFEKAALDRDWRMPFDKLYTGLKEKTRGRILRADLGTIPREEPFTLTEAQWQEFTGSVVETELYIEYSLKMI